MSEPVFVPVIPESAPFTAEQRAYLNGFLAGMFSRVPASAAPGAPAQPAKPLTPLAILFGSQTGNAENLAKRIAKEAGKRGFAPTMHDMAKYPTAQFASERHLLVVTSTYGDGEPPDNAKGFWEYLSGAATPKMPELRFSVCALGDTNYPKFCAFGKGLDERLEKLDAKRVHARTDCDVEFEEPFAKWLDAALNALPAAAAGQIPSGPLTPSLPPGGVEAEQSAAPAYSRTNPFPAPLITNRPLNGAGSAKDTRHFEFALDGSSLNYEVGDALGVRPTNCAELAEEILRALGCSGEEPVPGRDGKETSLREALLHHYEITRIPPPLLKAVADQTGDDVLKKLTAPGVNGELTKFLWGREVIDMLHAHPSAKFAPAEFVALLKKLQPRLYSIASSPKAHGGQVHLCVGVLRYDSLGRARKGVCSTFLAERVPAGGAVPVFIHSNKNFRPPANPDAPMILVGPGTGVAPFRAFLEERRAVGAKGENWLFFGDQRVATDYLYREEIETMQRDGTLAQLDTAFSRDQAEKIYVQNRMLEHARDIFAWIEDGAHFYVCGDASRMAKDVEASLHEIIAQAGGKTSEQAAEYVRVMKSSGRYQRDVY
ncbi:MAG: sulfite reductase subunit alpha [Verrucomicrobia bacterium]|nr:sulfite reductase subunit alpha [Verrucomicrobiota bacterium]